MRQIKLSIFNCTDDFKVGDRVKIICNKKTATTIKDKKWIDCRFPNRIGKITYIYKETNIIEIKGFHFHPTDLILV